ncbi:MAG: hypothetical protein J07HN4v3_01782 [Halonotius sp. J07HN4]|nr:MAG: hypothetical protein J07HN4v3_01782 [Halonotius sp. J07HN4]
MRPAIIGRPNCNHTLESVFGFEPFNYSADEPQPDAQPVAD